MSVSIRAIYKLRFASTEEKPSLSMCRSCQNRHWNQSCEKKAATGREILRAKSMGDDIELPEHVDSSGREVLRVESMGDDTELRKLLAALLNVPLGQIGRIRTTLTKQPAIIDVISIITRKNKNDSSTVWRRLEKHSRAVKVDRLMCLFPGGRQRPTPVAHDLKTLFQIIFLLPGREASMVRMAPDTLYSEFLEGDLSILAESREILRSSISVESQSLQVDHLYLMQYESICRRRLRGAPLTGIPQRVTVGFMD